MPLSRFFIAVALPIAYLTFAASTFAADLRSVIVEHSGKCLAVENASPANGAAIAQMQCNGSVAQLFDVQAISGPFISIVSSLTGKCLDVGNGDKRDNVVISQLTCNGTLQQRFQVLGGTKQNPNVGLAATHSQKCVGIAAADPRDGARLVQRPCTRTAEQRFFFKFAVTKPQAKAPTRPAISPVPPAPTAPLAPPAPSVQCKTIAFIDITQYSSGIQNTPMTGVVCESSTNTGKIALYYGAPPVSGQPTGNLFFQANGSTAGSSMQGMVTDYYSDQFSQSCGPVQYQARLDMNGAAVRIQGQIPQRSANCRFTGQSQMFSRNFHAR